MREQISIYRPLPDGPRHPEWSNREIDVIQYLSIEFAINVLNIRADPTHVWHIGLQPERGIDHVGLELFEIVLGRPRARAFLPAPAPPGHEEEVETLAQMRLRVEADLDRPVALGGEEEAEVRYLSSFSNILWAWKVVPERLYVPWVVVMMDQDGRRVEITTAPPHEEQVARRRAYGRTGLQTPPSTGSSSRVPGGSSVAPPARTRGNSQGSGRGWDPHTIRERTRQFAWNPAPDTIPTDLWCFYTANVALIHGWEDVFGQALQSLVWNWAPNIGFTHPMSAVRWMTECYLQEKRTEELNAIVDWFEQYGKDHQVDQYKEIANAFKTLPETLAPPLSIYGWMKQFQDALLDLQDDAQPSSSKKSKGKGKAHEPGPSKSSPGHRPGPSSKHTGRKLLVEIAKARSEKLSHRRDGQHEWVLVMLDQAHAFVAQRQQNLADTILELRHAKVAGWEVKLRKQWARAGPAR